MLRAMGAPIGVDAGSGAIIVDPDGWNGKLRAIPIVIPGDLSSATFLFVAAATVAGSDVTVENVGLNPTRSGALDALVAMGADIEVAPAADALGEPVGRVRVRASRLRGVSIAGELALRSIDEIPALAVAAALADGETVFADLAELRVKESDRIVAIARELRRAGVAVEERPDGFVVTGLGGRPPAGGTVQPEHDHRIAMAGAVMGLSADDETIIPAADIATSFPTFAETLAALARRSDGAPSWLSRRSDGSAAAGVGRVGPLQTFAAEQVPSVMSRSIRFPHCGPVDRADADVEHVLLDVLALARRPDLAIDVAVRPR